jgi:hypothetical protein
MSTITNETEYLICPDCGRPQYPGESYCPNENPLVVTPEQILTKAIEKAIANGWKVSQYNELSSVTPDAYLGYVVELTNYMDAYREFDYMTVIYSHDFAKALWGEKVLAYMTDDPERPEHYLWQYHLQQMVIADDPIKYLGDNL